MKTATGLALVAIGVILAIAVTAQPSFINLHIAGFVIALTGVAGLVIPRRGYSWLLRRVVVRRGPRGQVARTEERRLPPYLALNPAASDEPPTGPQPGDLTTPGTGAEPQATRVISGATVPGATTMPGAATVPGPPAEETVEEFIEE